MDSRSSFDNPQRGEEKTLLPLDEESNVPLSEESRCPQCHRSRSSCKPFLAALAVISLLWIAYACRIFHKSTSLRLPSPFSAADRGEQGCLSFHFPTFLSVGKTIPTDPSTQSSRLCHKLRRIYVSLRPVFMPRPNCFTISRRIIKTLIPARISRS